MGTAEWSEDLKLHSWDEKLTYLSKHLQLLLTIDENTDGYFGSGWSDAGMRNYLNIANYTC